MFRNLKSKILMAGIPLVVAAITIFILFVSAASSETVESTNDIGLWSSSAVDSNNIVHISHFDDTNNKLRYCNNSGGWSCAEIENGGMSSCIAIDSNDVVHISHLIYAADDLRYCNNSGGWNCVTLDATSVDDGGSSIAIGSDDIVHISYMDVSDLGYCNNSGGWSCAAVETTDTIGRLSSIALDSNDVVHISHRDQTSSDLRYCNNSNGWSCAALDTAGIVGGDSSIAVSSDDVVHISYLDDSNDYLKYCNNSGGWSCAMIDDPLGQSGRRTSLAIGPNDIVYISHKEITLDDLRFCNNSAGSWSCTKLADVSDPTSASARYLSIKRGRIVDSTSFSSAAHLSWYNNTDLIYINTTIFVSTCICPGVNKNWEVDMSEYCNITVDCNLGTGYFNFTGSGWCNCNATINTTNLGDPGSSGILYIQDDCLIKVN